MHPIDWLRRHDHDLAALRRAGRTAIVMPAMFAVGDKVLADPAVATFAAFGSFAMLLLVDFSGPRRERLQAQAALGAIGAVFVCIGTLASQNAWLAAAAMVVIGFVVIFAGVVSSVLAGATTALLLAFILPVSVAGPVSSVPDRLTGWGMATGAALIAVLVLWPAPTRDPLRVAAISACRALAARLRSEAAMALGGSNGPLAVDHDRAVEDAEDHVAALHRAFLATPYRPTGLTTATRTVVRLVDELGWLGTIVDNAGPPTGRPADRAACAVRVAAASVLQCGADLLAQTGGDPAALHDALGDLAEALGGLERATTTAQLATLRVPPEGGTAPGADRVDQLITSLDPSFRAQELSFAVSLVAHNIDLTAAAERRNWGERLLGRRPEGLPGRLSSAQERATAHIERHSVWLHNSLRGAVGLGLAVLVANESGVQHSFWVVLGTLSVLRSNALNTGQNAIRGLLGTMAGFILGAALLAVVGTDATLLWFLLPPAILLAGLAPAAISFAAGQGAFTLVLVILFNIIQPAGWRVGLLRVEDIAIGCSVSLVVGVLFWPRGAGAALRTALAEAYAGSAAYLASAVEAGTRRIDAGDPSHATAARNAVVAAAAARRLDDTFRSYLAERGTKPLPLAEVTSLVTGVAGLRLAADAVTDLWGGEVTPVPPNAETGGRTAARLELLAETELIRDWYADLGGSLVRRCELRAPLDHDTTADARLVDAIRHDLLDHDGSDEAAVRAIWTSDHLDAARRLQAVIIGPARAAGRDARRRLPTGPGSA